MTESTGSHRLRLRRWVSLETTSGALLLVGAALALIWANSPWRESYHALANTVVGPAALHLDLTVETWAADGLLAIFFFVVGVELKQEIVAGSLRQPREAAVPVFAAVGGMIMPAVLYVVIVLAFGDASALKGWAIPTATDIAFALAVLAIFGRGLPVALRTFLLTLAVVDDLLAIIVIAVFYTETIDLLALAAALAAVVVYAVLVRLRRTHWWLLLPVAVAAWTFMHSSGVHSTIAGVLMGFCVPAKIMYGEKTSRTTRFEHEVRPISSGIALPIFAFFAAGVTIAGGIDVFTRPVVIAIIVALVVGKLVGVLGTTALITRFTLLRLPDGIGIRDLFPVGLLTGIGFTVSLLIAELSFEDSVHSSGAKIAILSGTAISAVLASVSLRWDARKARVADMNADGIDDTDTGPIRDPGDH